MTNAKELPWAWQPHDTTSRSAYRIASCSVDLPPPTIGGATSSGDGESSSATASAALSQQGSGALPVLKVQHKRIDVGGWSLRTSHGPIGNAAEMDHIADLTGIPPPEMVFPHNRLLLIHERSGSTYEFDTASALCSIQGVIPSNVKVGKHLNAAASEDPAKSRLKVSYAKEWGRNRYVSSR